MTDIQKRLFTLQDVSYRDFQRQLIPNIDPQSIIGVRTPVLRKLAKEQEEPEAFLTQLPHRYFEENQLHSFLISAGEDFPAVIAAVDGFLPYVDNWATCDQLTPRCFVSTGRNCFRISGAGSGPTMSILFGLPS